MKRKHVLHHLRFTLPAALLISQSSSATIAAPDLARLLDNIDTELASLQEPDNESSWRLVYDRNFPCFITLHEQAVVNDETWTRNYRFELSDMESGQLVRSRDNRRAISYYAEKKSADGETKTYSPKKISNVQLVLAEAGATARIQAMVDAGIQVCEERNAFPEEE